MPTYCFRDENGTLFEHTMSVAQLEKCKRGQKWKVPSVAGLCTRDIAAEHRGFSDTPGAWPIKSDGAGVHPDQIPETRALLEARGVECDFDRKDGRAIFRDRHHRRRVCEALGIYDRNGGFSDPQQR